MKWNSETNEFEHTIDSADYSYAGRNVAPARTSIQIRATPVEKGRGVSVRIHSPHPVKIRLLHGTEILYQNSIEGIFTFPFWPYKKVSPYVPMVVEVINHHDFEVPVNFCVEYNKAD